MNHLAHLFLAPDTERHRIGSLMGDFAKGVDIHSLPPQIREGLIHHRSVDAFTDHHPDVIASRRLFSPQRRRFAGVALDILYDHFLLRHWYRFSPMNMDDFIEQAYGELLANQSEMPARMQTVTVRIVRHDWFRSYRDLDNIGYALDRVAHRIRFKHSFFGIIQEIEAHQSLLEERFLSFFPDLLVHARNVFK